MAAPGAAAVPNCIVPAPTTVGSGRSGLRELLAQHPDIDAMFCSSDMMALGVIMEAQAQGIDIPGRLAVVGMGDLAFSRDLHPALTSVRIDGTAIGSTAARFIIERSHGRVVPNGVVDIGFTIVERSST
jgi:LacI family gluconate utilization system Gnt-I transcriptional repressor